MADRQQQDGPLVPGAVCPTCGIVHSPGEVCTRYALSLALDISEAGLGPGKPSDPLAPPQARSQGSFHHYRIACRPDGTLWELGSGAMGVTYKAYDERLKLDVALKVINLAFMNDRGAHSLFLREARAAARVRHSNVASVLFLNDTPGNVFYAMEFVAGEPLSNWLKREGNISPLAAINIARQLASGLAAIHAEGLVHRDLKPGNVLLLPAASPAGGGALSPRNAPRVKIIDFGVAREITTDSDAVSTIGFRGTVAYASPEQCEEHFDLDGRSDLYSLGCILFEMLAGHPPFTARSRRAFLNLHVSEPPPIAILAEQPAPLVEVVARLLAKRPEERFEDAQSTIEALDRVQIQIEASGPDVGHTRAPVSSIRSIAGALGNLAKTSRGLPSLPEPFEPRRVWLPWSVAGLAGVAAIAFGAYLFTRPSTPAAPVLAPAAVVAAPAVALDPVVRAPAVPGARRAIAVMPFTSSGVDKENEYLADGLSADVLAQLTRIHGLKVISGVTPGRYKTGDRQDLQKLAQDLRVDSVLEGIVRRSGSGAKLTVQLVDAVTAENLWVGNFDADPATLAAVQSEITLNVVERLNVNIAASEKNALMRPPTGSAAAYQLYMKGQAFLNDPAEPDKSIDNAAASFSAAIEADPNYALAHARLSTVHMAYYGGRDHTDLRREQAFNSAETALRLQPDLPEAQLAMGNYHYRGFKAYDVALPYFKKAVATMPGNVEALSSIAGMDRRQGRWEKAAEGFLDAMELAPLNATVRFNAGTTLLYLRQYERAGKILEVGLKQQPNSPQLNRLRGELFVVWKGDLDPMRRDVEARPDSPSPDVATYYKVELLLLERRFDDALETLRTSKFALVDGSATYFTRDSLQAEILTQANRPADAKAAWERALPRLSQVLAGRTGDARLRLAHGFALAGTGDTTKAVEEATTATQLVSFENDAFEAPFYLRGLALVHARTGNLETARDLQTRILAVPSQYSKELFRLSPAWDPVRN